MTRQAMKTIGLLLLAITVVGMGRARAQTPSCAPTATVPPPCFVEVSVAPQQPYVGQQVTYSFRLFSRVTLVQNPPIYEAPRFEGFWLAGSPYNRFEQHTRDGVFYTATVSERLLFPLEAGRREIGPSRLVFEETALSDAFTLVTDATVVDVLALPPGAPPGFEGVVGQYALGASLDRQLVNYGEPVTLQVDVVGAGNVALLPAPVLAAPDTWRVFAQPARYEVSLEDGFATGAKVFTWQLFPDAPGAHTLAPIRLVTFDPDAVAYNILETSPVTITVLGSAPSLPAVGAAPEGQADLRPAVYAPPSGLRARSPQFGTWVVLLAWLAPPAVLGGVWWVGRRRAQREGQRALLRRRAALRRAQGRLGRATRQPYEQACKQLAAAVTGYFADVADAPESAITLPMMQALMLTHDVPHAIAESLLRGIQQAYEGRYAPGHTVAIRALAHDLTHALRAVDARVQA